MKVYKILRLSVTELKTELGLVSPIITAKPLRFLGLVYSWTGCIWFLLYQYFIFFQDSQISAFKLGYFSVLSKVKLCVLYRTDYTPTLLIFVAKHKFVSLHWSAVILCYNFPFWLRMIANVEPDFPMGYVISLHQYLGPFDCKVAHLSPGGLLK